MAICRKERGVLMRYRKPNRMVYRIARAVSWLASVLVFRLKIIRNDIRDKEGPFLVIANHQCALDYVNLIRATKRPMSFVLSKSFYNSLPITFILKQLGVIPKQQFQTSVADMKNMKAVGEAGEPLVIYLRDSCARTVCLHPFPRLPTSS